MKQNFEKSLGAVLHHEGGFVNHPSDPGGMTNLGVTKATWEEWLGHPVDEKAMKALTPEMVGPMYKRRYWDKAGCNDLPDGIDYFVFDTAVNSGPGRAIKLLQACVNSDVDGVLGPKTLAAVKAFEQAQLIQDYAKRRLSYLTELKNWPVFGKGWSRRVNEVEKAALLMIAD